MQSCGSSSDSSSSSSELSSSSSSWGGGGEGGVTSRLFLRGVTSSGEELLTFDRVVGAIVNWGHFTQTVQFLEIDRIKSHIYYCCWLLISHEAINYKSKNKPQIKINNSEDEMQ